MLTIVATSCRKAAVVLMMMGFAATVATAASHAPGTAELCDVRDYGARADNTTINTEAINAALSNSSCGTVVLRGGGAFISGSIHLRSHVTLAVEAGTELRGAPNDVHAYDAVQPNPWSQYQDFGHNHWRDALMWGEGVTDVTITGGGLIDGGGMSSGDPPPGGGDKVISLKSSSHVTVTGGLRFANTGHFVVLATNVEYLTLTDLVVHPTRDGFDIVGCRHVLVQNVTCSGGGDDALVLKSDFSLGKVLPSYNISVRDSSFSTDGATALEIGSETVGSFHNITMDNISVHSAGDAGIGMAIMDGSEVYDVTYSNIVMDGVDSPFQFYIGARLSHPAPRGVPGSIHDIWVENVTATSMLNTFKMRNWTATLDGQPADPRHNVSDTHVVGPNLTFRNVNLTYKGGGLPGDVNASCPHVWNHWFMVDEVRPAYAFFLRNTIGVTFDAVSIGFEKPDGRPCMVLDAAHSVTLRRFSCMRSAAVGGYDIGLRNGADGVHVYKSPGIATRRLD